METSGRSILESWQPTIGEARIHSLVQAIVRATKKLFPDEITVADSRRIDGWYEEIQRICHVHVREDAELTERSLRLAMEMQNLRIGAMELFNIQPQPTFVGRFAQKTPLEPLDTEGKSSALDPAPNPSR